MLTCDGLTPAQFLPLWRDAMWSSTSVDSRARLVLELGRLEMRESRVAPTLAVVFVPKREPPFLVMPLSELPTAAAPEVRERLRERLGTLGATEVYLLVTQRSPTEGGPVLVSAWGETLDGQEACWVQPFRPRSQILEEAPAMMLPEASEGALSRACSGLMVQRH